MTIIVPLDLSTVSSKAIEPAAEIARGVGDRILLVTVASARLRSDLSGIAEAEGTEVPEVIQSYLESTASELADVAADYRVIPGETAAGARVDFAEAQDAVRMLAMATHGRTGLERWRVG
jgi:nucleotide-binding universal stress UspA family protein